MRFGIRYLGRKGSSCFSLFFRISCWCLRGLKLKFDPVINTMTTRHSFADGKARFLRTITRPTLMGLISAREVDSVLREPESRLKTSLEKK